jgi:hypothetical protein
VQAGYGVANNFNSRSQTYAVARGLQRCCRCARFTPVIGLALFPGHETLESSTDAHVNEESAAADVWESVEARVLLFFVEYLPEAVWRRLQQFSKYYRLEYDEQEGQSYWMNHCLFCGAKQGDFELYCEPEGAFMPISGQAAAMIRFYEVPEPFEALAGGYLYEPEFCDDAQRPK